jgi:hypothetical protein
MLFEVPMMWRERTPHLTDCYFCMVPPIQNGITKKKKWTVEYPNIPLAIRPVPHCEGLSIPAIPAVFPYTLMRKWRIHPKKHRSHLLPEFFPNVTSAEPHMITQKEFPDLIRDLELSNNKTELLSSRFQQ